MKTKMFIAIIMAVAMAVPSFAACTNVCSTSQQYSCSKSVNTLTKGTSATLTTTITNMQSNAVTSLPATLQGSWFTASSSSTTISSIQASGGTANAEFSITPTSTGGQDVCVALGTTCTADCGTLTVASGAELNAASITAPSSAATSSTFTISATISNSGTETAGSTTAVTATLSSSQCTVSSETKTIGTIAGSGTSSVSWSITAPSSATTCTFSLSATGTPGGTATGSKSVTISAASADTTTSTTSSSGGGGTGSAVSNASVVAGTKVVTTPGTSTITIPEIKAGSAALVTIDKPAETNVRQIAIAVKNAVNNITLFISRAGISGPSLADKVFGYVQIEKINMTDADITSATIDFQVDKTWIDTNKIDKSKITLSRLSDNAWSALPTKQIGETDTYSSYRAESPGLSLFAITGKELPAATAGATPTPVTTAPFAELPKAVKDYGVWILVFIIGAAVLGYLYYHHEHARKTFGYAFKK